jgi:hypothetical protein
VATPAQDALTDERSRVPAAARARGVVAEFLVALAVYELYNLVQARLSGGTAHALRDGSRVWHLERVLHLDPEPVLNRLFDHVTPLGVAACYWYASFHFLVTVGVLVFVFRSRPDAYGRARAVLAGMTVSALVVFWLVPTAPPRMLGGTHLVDISMHYRQWGWWGDDSLPGHASKLANQYAAMPSLHVAWALWCGVTVTRVVRHRGVRALAMCYPAVTVLVVLGTANHYLADAVAGAALWFVTDRIVGSVPPAASLARGGLRLGCRVDAGELDDRRTQYEQQGDEQRAPARATTHVLVVDRDPDDDADDRVERRRRRQARRKRTGLERDLVDQQADRTQ